MKSRIDKLEYGVKLTVGGDVYYYKNNKRHRDKDLPAEIWKDGSRFWYKNGKVHRDNNNPSAIYSNGEMYWFENGMFIRNNSNEIKNR